MWGTPAKCGILRLAPLAQDDNISVDWRIQRLLWGPLFVGGGAVEGGDGDLVEAEVDAELGDVVDHVVEEHGAEGEGAWAVEDDLLAPGELPVGGEVLVGRGGE